LRVVLADGRALAYSEFGDPDGIPFIFMHGVPSSRLAGILFHEGARRRGVRVIAPDRPGYGYSDPDPSRTILDWPGDVAELADQLDIPQFGVMGISGAVPYVLACAMRLPRRVSHVAIISGLGPLREPGVMDGMNGETATLYKLAMRSPRLGRMWMKMLAQTSKRTPMIVFRQQLSYLPDVDRAIFEPEHMRDHRLADFAEAFRQGAGGAGQEAVLHMTDWGFTLADVPVEVFLWQGELDRHHPPAMGRYLARELPRCRAVFVPGVGAFGFIEKMNEIFDDLIGCPADARFEATGG
jgi:pimeloyl-ACP methyl ester carboxylesterase